MNMPIYVFLPIHYLIKFLLISIILLIFKKVTRNQDVHNLIDAVKSMCCSVVAEIIGIGIVLFLSILETSPMFFAVVILNFALNYLFVFRKVNAPLRQKIILTTAIVATTAPYLFLFGKIDV